MAIPNSPLSLTVDVQEMTLGELALFQGEFSAPRLIAFLADHSNWTRAEIERITIREMKEVSEQIGEALKGAAVPKEN